MVGMKVMNSFLVLYEDNHIIVVEKPCNILSQKDSTNDPDMLTMIKSYLKEKYHKPGNVYLGLIHRLDRPVSGVMVFAKTSKAASRLSEEIRSHRFQKVYYAVVHGRLPKEGVFEDSLYKMENGNTVVDNKRGKYSKLTYQVVSFHSNLNLSLVRIVLETGRHHQIRVQFASRGYPLYGDQRYGRKEKVPIALYCHEISFKHPTQEKQLIFSKNPERKDAWAFFDL